MRIAPAPSRPPGSCYPCVTLKLNTTHMYLSMAVSSLPYY